MCVYAPADVYTALPSVTGTHFEPYGMWYHALDSVVLNHCCIDASF